MKAGPADRLDADVAELLRAAAPYPDAPVDVRARVEKALAMRIAETLASASTEGSNAGTADATPKSTGLASLAAKPMRTIAATFLVGVAAGAGLHAAIRAPRERVIYVEKATPWPQATVPVENPGNPAPEGTLAPTVEAPQPIRRPSAAPAKSAGPEASDLGPEQALLDVARRALGEGRSAEALVPLDRHARRYPKGILAEEREALAINVLVTLRRYDEARVRSARFLRQYPDSLLRTSVEAAVAAIP
jgi:TolA-binding protein